MYARPLPIFQILKLKNMQLGIFSNRPFFQELFFFGVQDKILYFFLEKKNGTGCPKNCTAHNDK